MIRPRTRRFIAAAGALTAYVVAVVGANVLTSWYGQVWVAPGLLTTAGTYAAGAALFTRDAVQETAGRRAVLGAVAVGAAASVRLAGPHLAIASGVAFLFAEMTDMAVYTPLRRRSWTRAVLVSNAVGAVLDTAIFLGLAGFPITFATVTGQLVGKVVWATAAPLLVVLIARKVGRRAVPQPTVGA